MIENIINTKIGNKKEEKKFHKRSSRKMKEFN